MLPCQICSTVCNVIIQVCQKMLELFYVLKDAEDNSYGCRRAILLLWTEVLDRSVFEQISHSWFWYTYLACKYWQDPSFQQLQHLPLANFKEIEGVFPIAVYCSTHKPDCLSDYLKDFIEDMRTLECDGYADRCGKKYDVILGQWYVMLLLEHSLSALSRTMVSGPTKLSQSILSAISDRLIIVRSHVPCEFSRKPRSLSEFKLWKATELRLFLVYTGPVVLKGLISPEFYTNFLDLCCNQDFIESSFDTTLRGICWTAT